jgi:iron(III) transport system permease protein
VALLEYAGPVQRAMRAALGPGATLPDIRSLWGVAFVMTLVLYPYVYLLARGAFAQLDASQVEAARSLGLTRGAAFRRVALPAARPAIAAGCALAVMEALADFGTVSVFGVRTLTEAIYRVWFGMFDRVAATQLAAVLLLVTVALLALERWSRGRARVAQAHGRSIASLYPPLRGWRGWLAAAACALVLGLAFVLPLGTLLLWAVRSGDAWAPSRDLPLVASTLKLSAGAAALTATGALVFAYARRLDGRRLARVASAVARLGYSVPGPVLAVGALVVLAAADRALLPRVPGVVAAWLPPLLTGSLAGLLAAYFARFAALALMPVEAGLGRLGRELDEAARTLGASPGRLLARVHAPLLRGSLAAACLLVFVDVMKEMPMTLLLRPLGMDTLAVAVWQRTTEGLWEAAAVPSLTIVAAGLVPVALVHRLGEAWRERSK